MSKLNKKIKKSYHQAYAHDDNIDNVKQHIEFSNKKRFNFFKSKFAFTLTTCAIVILVTSIIIGCSINKNSTKNKEIVKDAIISLELNPAISISVNDEGIVTAVYGDNNEGKMIIININTELINKKYDEALNIIINELTKCGYFVQDSLHESYNNLKITLTSIHNEMKLDEMEAIVKEKVETSLTNLNINVKNKITIIKNYEKEKLVEKATSLDHTLSVEAANNMTNEELLKYITAYYLEVTSFPTTEIEEMYQKFKNQEIDLTTNRIYNEIINNAASINDLHKVLVNGFYESCNKLLDELQQKYNEIFIAPDSHYQKEIAKINEIKKEILKLRLEVESETNEQIKESKNAILNQKEQLLISYQNNLNSIRENSQKILDELNLRVDQAFEVLKNSILSNEELTTLINSKTEYINSSLNDTKDNLINIFETKYKSIIENTYNNVQNNKQELIDQLKK